MRWLVLLGLHAFLIASSFAQSFPKPFDKLTLVGIDFVLIPAGHFVMGTTAETEAELRRWGWWNRFLEAEQPAHRVIMDQPFLMSQTELTQGQWKAVMGKMPKVAFEGEKRPVESCSFDEVQSFVKKINEMNMGRFRLPTEAEWEYAARAGSWGVFAIGEKGRQFSLSDLGDYAWFQSNADGGTHEVGLKKPNAWGLYDMLGNVWEWCSDYYDRRAYKHRSGKIHPRNAVPFPERVMRGGSWFLPDAYQRPAIRSGSIEDQKSPYIGFRLVCELPKNVSINPFINPFINISSTFETPFSIEKYLAKTSWIGHAYADCPESNWFNVAYRGCRFRSFYKSQTWTADK